MVEPGQVLVHFCGSDGSPCSALERPAKRPSVYVAIFFGPGSACITFCRAGRGRRTDGRPAPERGGPAWSPGRPAHSDPAKGVRIVRLGRRASFATSIRPGPWRAVESRGRREGRAVPPRAPEALFVEEAAGSRGRR